MKRSAWVGPALSVVAITCACTKPAQPGARTDSSASAPSASAAKGQRVSGVEARALVAKGAVLVDVRTPNEFQTDGLPGALNVPYDQVETRAAELGAKDRPLVLYCHSGRRSGIAARTLVRLGYSSVYDLGPRTAW
jgi:phage shock protein E